MDRRDFLKGAALGAGLAASSGLLTPLAAAAEKEPAKGAPAGAAPSSPFSPPAKGLPHPAETRKGEMLYRELGRTGEKVSALGVGGFHIDQPTIDEATSLRIIRDAIDGGITFMDNCWDYNDGASEERMGKALQGGYRDKVFLMTKVDGRNKETAETQIDESLKRLRTDHLDLLQFHEVIRMEDPDRIFAEGGAVHAVVAAQKAGKIRFIGFTGHKDPLIHLRMLEIAKAHDFHFDTVQMPVNILDAHFRSFQRLVLPVLIRERIAPLAMKSMGAGVILKSGKVQATQCLRYALSQPVSVVITGIDSMEVLKQDLDLVRSFKPMSETEIASLLEATAQVAAGGQYELFKTDSRFDGTAHNPQWLG